MSQRRKKRNSDGGGWLWGIIIVVTLVLIARGQGEDEPAAPPPVENNPQQLAAQVLQVPEDIVLTESTRVALEGYAQTGNLASFCGDAPFQLDPLLLQALLQLQREGFRVLVNNLGIGNDRVRRLCYDKHGNRTNDRHVQGRAVDLNGIILKGGPQTSWGDMQFRPGPEMQAIQSYADRWLAILPRNRGGVGQEGCLNGRPRPGGFHVAVPPDSANPDLASFGDSCSHLHLDVREL